MRIQKLCYHDVGKTLTLTCGFVHLVNEFILNIKHIKREFTSYTRVYLTRCQFAKPLSLVGRSTHECKQLLLRCLHHGEADCFVKETSIVLYILTQQL